MLKSNPSQQNKLRSADLKQNNLYVSGSKAALVARALDFSNTVIRNNERNSANDSDTELLSSDSEYDSDSHTSTSGNNSDLDSDDSETDGCVEHSYAVLFVPDDDIQQVRDGPLENSWGREGGGAGEVQKKYSRKGKLNENKIHARQIILKKIHTRNLITKKIPSTPPPPITFLMVRP